MTKNILSILIVVLTGICFTAPCFAGWLVFNKLAYRGRIIDAETKEPIQGAVVVAMYSVDYYIGPPAGSNPTMIHIKETLTDEKGEFYIPSYTTPMGPNSYELTTEFIIYKPEYGNYPRWQTSPPYFVNADDFFSGELGTTGEIQRKSKVVSFIYGVVELPRLKNEEERARAVPPPPTDKKKDTPLLYNAINEEAKRFGWGLIGR